MVKKVFSLLGVMLLSFSGFAQSKQLWVDSVFQTLSLEEKISQLFLLEVNASSENGRIEILNDVKTHNLGGIILTGGGVSTVKNLTATLQSISKVPLLIGIDAENGAGKILDSAFAFPPPLLISATGNDSLLYVASQQIAQQLKSLGINLTFAPNALTPEGLHGDTLYAFWGNDLAHIQQRTMLYLRAMHDQEMLACVKNFPSHYFRTVQQSKGAPIVVTVADSINLAPFQHLIDAGIDGIFPTSQSVPLAFERKAMIQKLKFLPSALSNVLTNTQIENSVDFDGLLFANVPDIKLTSGKIRWGEPELFAFQAGNDLLINPQNILSAKRKIKKLAKREKVYQQQLDKSVRKILAAKYDAGLRTSSPVNAVFDETIANQVSEEIFRSITTVIEDKQHQLPIRIVDTQRFASLSIGVSANNLFNFHLAKYTQVDEYCMPLLQDSVILKNLGGYSTVIVGIFPFAASWHKEVIAHLLTLATKTNLIIVHFGNPELIGSLQNFETVIATYTAEHGLTQLVAEQLFGSLPIKGTLPIAVGKYATGHGLKTQPLGRLGYGKPETVQMDSQTLEKINDIAYEAINAGATPGCRVLVARKGKIIYDKSFGWLTYENQVPVTEETIYDLASVTKVAATLQTTTFLYEKGLIDINKKMSVYLPELKGTNKEDFLIKDILTHQAGLWPFLPFWAQTVKDSLFLPEFYASTRSDNFPFDVSHNLYASTFMKDSLWQWIIKSKVREKPARTPYDYRYSDMGFYMLQRLAERILNQPIEDFLVQNLYDPLGASSLGYLPLNRFDANRIAPTEKDKLFRRSLLIGHVHDQGAAMHGGVAGHAGLFGTAMDLAKLGQLWLNGGSYAGLDYFKKETVHLFTQKQFTNSRRGLGWDKRDFVNEAISPTSKYSSANTFGHTGFTGTCLWVDPDQELVYVFLSNRVHPDMTNNKLLNLNIRTRIHDVVYESIFNYIPKSTTSLPLSKLTE